MKILKSLAFVVFLVSFVAPSQMATATLVHEWKFENNFDDTSGSGNDGTATGSPSFIAGVSGQGINLAAGDSVDKLLANNLPIASNAAFSINLWYNRSDPAVISSYFGGIGNRARSLATNRVIYAFGPNGVTRNDIYFYTHGPATDIVTGVDYATDGLWHMLTVTGAPTVADPTELKVDVYHDAVWIAGRASSSLANVVAQVGVGGAIDAIPGNFDVGGIDEFTVWDNALSQTEIDTIFTSVSVPEPSAFLLLTSLSLVLAMLPEGRMRQRRLCCVLNK